MATSSTVATARRALVDAIAGHADLSAVHVAYAWPGPEIANEHEAIWVDRVKDWRSEIPNIKSGRKQRQESYAFELVIWVARPDLSSDDADTVFDRTVALLAVVDDVLADDVQAGDTSVQLLRLAEMETDLVPFQTGWACQLIVTVEGQARLT